MRFPPFFTLSGTRLLLSVALLSGCGKPKPLTMEAPPTPAPASTAGAPGEAKSGEERPPVGREIQAPDSLLPDRIGAQTSMASLDNAPSGNGVPPGVPVPDKPAKPGSVTWNRWRGPNHNGLSHETDWSADFPRSGPKILWRQQIGVGFSSLSIAQERVYTMGHNGGKDALFCLHAETGEIVWRSGYPARLDGEKYPGGPSATPTVHEGKVYALGKQGQFVCLDARNGANVWARNISELAGVDAPRYGFAGSPLVLGNQVILNVGGAGAAFDKDTGSVLWFSKGVGGYASPVPFRLADRPAVLIFGQKNLVAVDPANLGRGIWSHPWNTQDDVNASDPIVVRNKIFASSGYGTGCAMFRLVDGMPKPIWHTRALSSHFNPAVAVGNFVYGIDGQANSRWRNSLVCVNLTNGARTWERRLFGFGSLISAGGRLLALTDLGELIVIEANPHAYVELGYGRILRGRCWTAPAFSGGRLFARDAKGAVVCVDLRPAKVEGDAQAKNMAKADKS